jgi:uncharacterized protein (DUF1330 family)
MACGRHGFQEPRMSVYMIAEIQVTHPEGYAHYIDAVPAVVRRHGGRYLVRGGKVTPLFGDWSPQRIIMLEFDSLEQLQACFTSEEYRRIAPFREQSTVSRSIIVESCEQPE